LLPGRIDILGAGLPSGKGQPDLEHATILCGGELARDSALTFNINAECYGLIASKLAPTGVVVFSH